ncbi:MAG: hypothetical protein ABIP75_02155, partial [Pyrinomonadaceae bacterium]
MKTTTALTLFFLVVVAPSCKSSRTEFWRDGEYVGQVTLTRIDVDLKETKTEVDDATFTVSSAGKSRTIKLNAQSVLPDCELKAVAEGYVISAPPETPPKICNVKADGKNDPFPVGYVNGNDDEAG